MVDTQEKNENGTFVNNSHKEFEDSFFPVSAQNENLPQASTAAFGESNLNLNQETSTLKNVKSFTGLCSSSHNSNMVNLTTTTDASERQNID